MQHIKESVPSERINPINNKLARELMEARPKLRERALIEGKQAHYKVSETFIDFFSKCIEYFILSYF